MPKWFSGMGMDVRQALRGLAASRSLTVVACLSLAIGIGANTAIFGVVRTLLLDPMAVRAPEELALVYWHQPGRMGVSSMNASSHQDEASGLNYRSNYSYPIYRAMRDAAPASVDLAGFNFLRDLAVSFGDDSAIPAGGLVADGQFFQVLGPQMALGRPLGDEGDRPGAPVVAVLSHKFWRRVFGGDPSVVGRQLRVNGVPAEVIGITAEKFGGLSKGGFFPQTDVTLPLSAAGRLMPRWGEGESLLSSERHFWVRVLARVAPSSTSGSSDGVRGRRAATSSWCASPMILSWDSNTDRRPNASSPSCGSVSRSSG